MSRPLPAINADRERVRARIHDLTAEGDVLAMLPERSAGQDERIERLQAGIAKAERELESFDAEAREVIGDYIRSQSGNVGPDGRIGQPTQPTQPPATPTSGIRSAALRAVERLTLTASAGDRLDGLIRDERGDPAAIAAQYLAAVSAPDYASAFFRALREPQTAHLSMTPAELGSMREVRRVMEMRAGDGMTIGTPGEGGYGVPAQIDPSIILAGDGAIHPFRELGTGRTIVSNVFLPVTSEGATVSYGAELSDVDDGSPALLQPPIYAERGAGWVPFSIEVGQDYRDLTGELGAALRDARDTLDAEKFANGEGHGAEEPEGVLTGLGVGQFLPGSAGDTDDVYGLVGALPARFSTRGRMVSNISTLLGLRQLVGGGSDEPPIVSEDLSRLAGRPWHEASTFADGTLVYGDWSKFYVVDRLGFTIELVPHVFNTSTGLPKGQRGLFAIWRSGSGVVVPNAFRALAPGS